MRVAVLGIGIMGAGMARSLQREGHEVVVWNRTRSKADPLAEHGIGVADTVADAVSGADAVISILFDEDATLAVTDELVGALGPDAVWIQSATLGPDGVERVAAAAGREVLDAPVLGTKKPAEDGKLIVLVAGAADLVARATPVFEAIGARTIEVGARVGDASALKLVCNSWIVMVTSGTAQAIAFAQHLGVDPALFLEAIAGGPLDMPYAQLKGRAMLAGDFDPSFALDGVLKDIALMIQAAGPTDFPPDLLEAVRSAFGRASEAGHGAEDMAAVHAAFTA